MSPRRPEQPPHEPSTRHTVASNHDTAMSRPKTTSGEDLLDTLDTLDTPDTLDNAPPIAITSASDVSLLDTLAAEAVVSAGQQDGGSGSGSGSGREDLLGLDTKPSTELGQHNPSEHAPTRQHAAEETRPSESDATPEAMESSVSTLKPTKPQYLTINTNSYVDPTPPTPTTSQPPSRTGSEHRSKGRSSGSSPTPSDAGYDETRFASEDEREGTSRSEIQSIIEQFPEDGSGPGAEEVMSPRLEITSPHLASPPLQHPPRKSSLEPLAPSIAQQLHELQGLRISNASPTDARSKGKPHAHDHGPPVPPKDGRLDDKLGTTESPVASTTTLHRPPPPEPEPEPALPFDFHRFLDQLKHKKADPVARYLKSFLNEFGKRQWMVHEQVKIISDFLTFIANKMAQCEVWREVSDAEFDNAREGMEKLVMNRLYTQTFSPTIPAPQPIPGAKPKKRGGDLPMGPGRKGQHQEDVERDDILAQKISIYGWVREEHLDIPAVTDSGKRFLSLAQQGQSHRREDAATDANGSRAFEDQVLQGTSR